MVATSRSGGNGHEGFGEILKAERTRSGLTQAELASRAGLSVHAVSSYELGRRVPADEGTVRGLAAALGIDSGILLAVAHVGGDTGIPLAARTRMRDIEACVERYPWPCLVNNENIEVVAMNHAARHVAGVGIDDLVEPGARHLLRLILDVLGERLINRDEVLRRVAAILKSDRVDPSATSGNPRLLPAVMSWLASAPADVREYVFGIWATTPPWTYGNRLSFDADWCTSDGEALRFHCVVTPWNVFQGVWGFDWLPADGRTWEWLRARSGLTPDRRRPGWNNRLEERRLAYGLSRAELAGLSGVSESAVYQWERGTRRPTLANLATLVRGMVMDGATAGLIADDLGLEPIASAAYRYLHGEMVEGRPDLASLEVRDIDSAHIQGEIEAHAWPCVVVGASGQFVCANRQAAWLTGAALRVAPDEPATLLGLAGSAKFREQCLNWPAVAPVLLEYPAQVLPRRPEASEAVLEAVLAQPGGEAILSEIAVLTGEFEPEPPARSFVPLHWRAGDAELTFHCVISPWNLWDPFVAIDLHPADGVTWEWVNNRRHG